MGIWDVELVVSCFDVVPRLHHRTASHCTHFLSTHLTCALPSSALESYRLPHRSPASSCFPCSVVNLLLEQYGVPSLVKQYLAELLLGLKEHVGKSLRLRIFVQALGFVANDGGGGKNGKDGDGGSKRGACGDEDEGLDGSLAPTMAQHQPLLISARRYSLMLSVILNTVKLLDAERASTRTTRDKFFSHYGQ